MMLDAAIALQRGNFSLDVCFSAPAGVTALFGPSGAGKSTVLAAIAGLVRIDSGHVRLGERVLTAPGVSVPAHEREVGVVFQEARLFPHLSVRGNLEYARRRSPAPAPFEIADVARHFDLAHIFERPVRNLSGGERSRVALARSLLAAPKLLLLDEPFAALDGRRRRDFIARLRRMHLTFALPMIVVTHQIDDAAAIADHVVAINGGSVVAQGDFVHTTALPDFQNLLDRRDAGVAVRSERVFHSTSTSDAHVWVRADQVLVAATRPQGLSARNIWQGRVASIAVEDNAALVRIETDAGSVLSRVTREALQELDLRPGATGWAVVKAHAL
ncbi:MAG: ATP-binding cassette domain-containing protein [Proteobacteria bacterium]|nr:ATP-binding cassette domain-containing protein [Pseudomonadota bacterium]